jgi:hypothetical protein
MKISGQGTIEYLVIIGIIIVAGLVVAGFASGFIDNAEQINSNSARIDSAIGAAGISIIDLVLDQDGNGAMTIKNVGGEEITLTRITVNGVDNNFNIVLFIGDDGTFLLNNLTCTCAVGETSHTCNYIITYTRGETTTNVNFSKAANCQSSISSQTNFNNPIITCTSFSYSDWTTCGADSLQTRTVQSSSPASCTGGTSVTTQSCNYDSFPCTLAGAGTAIDPIKLCDCNDLILMDANADMRNSYFSLGRDINCYTDTRVGGDLWNSGLGFDPIGSSTAAFTGELDGNNHALTDLFINREELYVGLFGWIDNGGQVKDLNLENVNITSSSGTVGGLSGYLGYTNTSADNIFVSGEVNSGGDLCGGIIGYLAGDLNDSHSTATVIGTTHTGGLAGWVYGGDVQSSYFGGTVSGTTRVGGITGSANTGGKVFDSYNAGNVTGTNYVGGVAGSNEWTSDINRTYNTGSVTCTADSCNVGGVVGYDNQQSGGYLSHSYSTGPIVGGTGANANAIVGMVSSSGVAPTHVYYYVQSDETTNCYYDQSSSLDSNTGCSPQTTEPYFYDVSNAPLSTWTYPPWSTSRDGVNHPLLSWQ